jgi:hypothetical protein
LRIAASIEGIRDAAIFDAFPRSEEAFFAIWPERLPGASWPASLPRIVIASVTAPLGKV